MIGNPSLSSIKALVLRQGSKWGTHESYGELQQEISKHESNPSGMKKTQQLQDEEFAFTQELEVKQD